jgi:glycerophosphoryl diester phosphodiesterase
MPHSRRLARTGRPWVVAHRGWSARFPENTLAAFDAAVAAGADVLELDVRLSRDRVPVVIHDATLERTTNATGRVADHSAGELAELDAGGWFAPRFAGEPVPTLAQVFARYAGRVAIDVEVKAEAFEEPAPEDAIERQVAALARRHGMAGSVLVSSFEHRLVARLATGGAAVAAGWLHDGPADESACAGLHATERALACIAPAEHLAPEDVERHAAAGMRLVAFTVDDATDLRRLLDWGVGGIVTNDPPALVRLL